MVKIESFVELCSYILNFKIKSNSLPNELRSLKYYHKNFVIYIYLA